MLEQRKVKAKATHTRDGAGAGDHSCGKAEVVLVVMQGFLEDYELGGGWEGTTQLHGKGRFGREVDTSQCHQESPVALVVLESLVS